MTASILQQNSVSLKGKHRKIINMVRSLIAQTQVLKTLLQEVENWSVHVLNKNQTFDVQNMTPEEAWSGRKPVIDYFKIFGVAYAHIP